MKHAIFIFFVVILACAILPLYFILRRVYRRLQYRSAMHGNVYYCIRMAKDWV